MTRDESRFAQLMSDAHFAVRALDEFAMRECAKAAAKAVAAGKSVHSRLVDHQNSVRMTAAESALLQTALDILRARLRFFGEST